VKVKAKNTKALKKFKDPNAMYLRDSVLSLILHLNFGANPKSMGIVFLFQRNAQVVAMI
jgi:hypothetical protein